MLFRSERIDRLRKRFTKDLERRGVADRDLKVASELVAAALRNSISDERGRWVLGPHSEARSEQRLRLHNEQGLRSYVIDRLFRDDNGDRWIVDFKTSRHEGAGLEEFLDEQRKRYETQLTAYARAVGGTSRLGLYFPLLRSWRQWDSSANS